MSYQTPNPRTVQSTPRRPISTWWPIGFGIGAIVLYAIGGGLIGAGPSLNYDDSGNSSPSGTWAGGVAMCVLGALASIAWIVLLVLYLNRRQTPIYWSPAAGLVGRRDFPAQPNPQPQPHPVPQPESLHTKGDGRFCGQCGNFSQTQFCPRCGASVPDV
jgi:hypothetical protein